MSDTEEAVATGTPERPSWFARADRQEVVGLMREMSILARGKHSLADALRVLTRAISNKELSGTIGSIAKRVEEGSPLSQAMRDYPWYFSSVTAGVVEAAEVSGSLDGALDQIATNLEDDEAFSTKLVDALLYPAVLFAAFFIVGFGLLIFVVPQFAEYIVRSGGKLEGVSIAILSISEFFRSWYGVPLIALISVAAFIGIRNLRRRNPLAFEEWLGRVPVLGTILMRASLKRVVATLHLLVSNNVALPRALELCQGITSNAYIRHAVDAMRRNVEAGKSMAEAMREYPRLNPVVVDMVGVGEETGALAEMLGHLDKYLRADFDRLTGRLAVLIQPLVLVLIGGLFVVVFLTFFLPYFEVLTSLSTIK